MEATQPQHRPSQVVDSPATGDVLAVVSAAFDRIDHALREGASDRDRLAWVKGAQRVSRRAEALFRKLVAEADVAGSSKRLHGTPTTSWLALDGQTTARQAAGAVLAGQGLKNLPEVEKQALAGRIAPDQARAIEQAMEELPATLTHSQREAAEGRLLERAQSTPADGLRRAAPAVLDAVRPPGSESERREAEQIRLAEQRARAHRRRSLWFWDDRDGSVQFKGSLPTVAAEGFQRLIAAYVESDRRRGRDTLDPRARSRTGEQRRADALVQLLQDHQRGRQAPSVAGDRPRVTVVMQEADLRARAEQAGVLGSGQAIGAGDLRRLVCDAVLSPVVLGSDSTPVDVGRDHRLVTAPLRRLLSLRDGGCAFPGCEVTDERCEAHHVVPWWALGATDMSNLVLLCPHHHAEVEPDRLWQEPRADSWRVRINERGNPEFIPPSRLDPDEIPIPANRQREGPLHCDGGQLEQPDLGLGA